MLALAALTGVQGTAEAPIRGLGFGSWLRTCSVVSLALAVIAVWLAEADRAALRPVDPAHASAIPPRPDVRPSLRPSQPVLVVRESGRLADLFVALDYRLEDVRAGTASVPRVFLARMPGEFGAVTEIALKKRLFLKATLPLVLAANEAIMEERRRLERVAASRAPGRVPNREEAAWLAETAARYGIASGDLDALLQRVDIVPPSLALAQAAIESGWGTSRFAREEQALFGQRLYAGGSGMVPAGLAPGSRFRVQSFPHLAEAVRSYIHNLNTHSAYREFRRARASSPAGPAARRSGASGGP